MQFNAGIFSGKSPMNSRLRCITFFSQAATFSLKGGWSGIRALRHCRWMTWAGLLGFGPITIALALLLGIAEPTLGMVWPLGNPARDASDLHNISIRKYDAEQTPAALNDPSPAASTPRTSRPMTGIMFMCDQPMKDIIKVSAIIQRNPGTLQMY